MTGKQEIKKNSTKTRLTSAFRDLIMIAVISVIVFVLSYFFDAFVFIVRFLEKNPRMIVYVDEIFTGFLTLSIGLAVFSWRRWVELKKETTERIKLQEELIKIMDTKVETERIISKQLQSEIEIRKQTERYSGRPQ